MQSSGAHIFEIKFVPFSPLPTNRSSSFCCCAAVSEPKIIRERNSWVSVNYINFLVKFMQITLNSFVFVNCLLQCEQM